MKERIKLSLQEELKRETEELKKEIDRHPELESIRVDEEMDAAFAERIRALEKAVKEERRKEELLEAERLRDEAEFAEELMPETGRLEVEHPKAGHPETEHTEILSASRENTGEGEERKTVVKHRGKRKRALIVALAAVLVLMMGMSITAVGSKSYLKQLIDKMYGNESMHVLNVDDMDVMSSDDGEETTAYKRINDALGIYMVRITDKPEGMVLEDVWTDEEMTQARIFYQYKGEVIRYAVYLNDNDSSWSEEEEDTLVKEYELMVKDVDITIREYKVKNYKEHHRIAEFVYQGAHYQMSGVMKKEEFEEILKNLHFF